MLQAPTSRASWFSSGSTAACGDSSTGSTRRSCSGLCTSGPPSKTVNEEELCTPTYRAASLLFDGTIRLLLLLLLLLRGRADTGAADDGTGGLHPTAHIPAGSGHLQAGHPAALPIHSPARLLRIQALLPDGCCPSRYLTGWCLLAWVGGGWMDLFVHACIVPLLMHLDYRDRS